MHFPTSNLFMFFLFPLPGRLVELQLRLQSGCLSRLLSQPLYLLLKFAGGFALKTQLQQLFLADEKSA